MNKIQLGGRASKLLRIFVTFTLVFGLSFHVEMAIAAIGLTDEISAHENDTLTGMTIYQLDPTNNAAIGDKVRSTSETVSGTNNNPLNVTSDGVKVVAVPTWKEYLPKNDVIPVANYVEWFVNDNPTPVSRGEIFNISQSVFEGAQQIIVTCRLNETALAKVDPSFSELYPGAKFEVAFVANYTGGSVQPVDESRFLVSLSGRFSGSNINPQTGKLVIAREDGINGVQLETEVQALVRSFKSDGSYDEATEVYSNKNGSIISQSRGLISAITYRLLDENDTPLNPAIATINENGVLITKRDGAYKVECRVVSGDREVIETFSVMVLCSTQKQSVGFELHLEGSNPTLAAGATSLKMTRKEAQNYQFIVKIRAFDNKSNMTIFEYSSDSDISLPQASTGRLDALEWRLIDDITNTDVTSDIATITPKGLLKVSKDARFSVSLAVRGAWGDNVLPTKVSLEVGNPDIDPDEELQGPSRPQDALQIVGNVPLGALTANEKKSYLDAEKQSQAGSSSSSQSESYEAQRASDSRIVSISKTYAASEVKKLEPLEAIYKMNSEAYGFINIKGQGPTLKSVLTQYGISSFSGVKEIKFVDYSEGSVTIKWDTLSSGSNEPILAYNSRVYRDENDALFDNKELLDNTCFRLLFDGSKNSGARIDSESLRYIKRIEINPNDNPSNIDPPEEDLDAPFKVEIGYVPVPIGQEAVFVAIPSKEIAGISFEFSWEESSDNGRSWKTVSEDQTYRTTTTKARIGHLFRVWLKSSKKDPSSGEIIKTKSDPVMMQEGDKDMFSASLIYDPPYQGEPAFFQVRIIDPSRTVDVSRLEYVWEVSMDGCRTWEKLAKQYQNNPTLTLRLQDTSNSSGEGSSEGNNDSSKAVYIRARVIETVGKKRVAITPPQLLTVRKGKRPNKPNKDVPHQPTPPKKIDLIGEKTSDKPIKNDSYKDKQKQEAEKKEDNNEDNPQQPFNRDQIIGDEEEDLIQETTGDAEYMRPSENGERQSTQSSASASPSQPVVEVNKEISDKIKEQEAAKIEAYESTVPGARWKSLTMSGGEDGDQENVLSDNPFAPFAIPTGLGFTFAGVIERIIAFRRQF